MLKRVIQFVMLVTVAWCVMTTAHELGHIFCGLSCGGTLKMAELRPWYLPYSLFHPDPRPLITLWGGPLIGVILPLAFGWLVRQGWMWFIAHFCLVANGTYLLAAWISGDRHLDTTKLLEHGAHPLSIAVYCVATLGFGYVGFRRHCIRMLSPPGIKPVDQP